MNCKDTRKLLNLELDGAATTEQLKAIQTHIETCQTCAREKEELAAYGRAMKSLFSDADVPELSHGFDAAFERRLAEKPSLLRRINELGLPARLLAPAAAVAALMALTLMMFPGAEKSPVDVVKTGPVISQAEKARAAEVVDAQVKDLLTNFL